MLLIFLPLLLFFLFLIWSSPLLKIILGPFLNSVGLQLGNHIYTPLSLVYSPQSTRFDLVLLQLHQDRLEVHQLLHQNRFEIELHHVPVGCKLVYLCRGEEKEFPYIPGTPFQLTEGLVVLSKRQKRGFGFIYEEVASGTKWPLY